MQIPRHYIYVYVVLASRRTETSHLLLRFMHYRGSLFQNILNHPGRAAKFTLQIYKFVKRRELLHIIYSICAFLFVPSIVFVQFKVY